MKTTTKTKKTLTVEDYNNIIIELIQDKKGNEIVSLDLRNITEAVADFFIVCDCQSTTQTRAIVDYIDFEMKDKHNQRSLHLEGRSNGEWCLIDYGDIVVHVFLKEKREFFQLEELWCDAKLIAYE